MKYASNFSSWHRLKASNSAASNDVTRRINSAGLLPLAVLSAAAVVKVSSINVNKPIRLLALCKKSFFIWCRFRSLVRQCCRNRVLVIMACDWLVVVMISMNCGGRGLKRRVED